MTVTTEEELHYSVPGKAFCSVILNRMKEAVDAKCRKQAGFRPKRFCVDQIFSYRQKKL